MKLAFLRHFGVIFISSCVSLEAMDSSAKSRHLAEYHTNHYIYGVVSAKVEINCPGGVAKIYEGYTYRDGLVNIVTLGLYNPRTAKVVCADSQTNPAKKKGA